VICCCCQLTSVEVVTSFISRIRQVNPYINAVVANRFEEALKEAEEVDRLLDGDNLPDKLSEVNAPFLGVPVTTKEALSVAGKTDDDNFLELQFVRGIILHIFFRIFYIIMHSCSF
jgi:Asp-tRNA(Asn)/Glu-tRNA(Gln) amidotransferase A subunit family amidase